MIELIKLDTLSEENFKSLYNNVCKENDRRRQARKRQLMDNFFDAWKALEEEGYEVSYSFDEDSCRLYREDVFIN